MGNIQNSPRVTLRVKVTSDPNSKVKKKSEPILS